MGDAIIQVFEWIIDLLDFSGGNGTDMVAGNLSSLMPGFYAVATGLCYNAIMPLAYTVLALFMLLELYKAAVRIEGAGGGYQTGAEVIFRVLIKMALCKFVLDNTPQLLVAIHDTFGGLVGNLSSSTAANIDLASLEAQVEDLGFFESLPYLLLSFICLLIAAATYIAAQIIILARAVELYLYVAVAPLPLATFPHDEMSSIGKNFLKSFAAIGLQGVLIWLVLRFLPTIFGTAGASGEGLLWTLLGAAAQCITVFVALTSTGRISKSILQAT